MPTVPSIDTSVPNDGIASGRAFTNPAATPSAPGVSGFKTAAVPQRQARIGETNPDIRSGQYDSGKVEAQQLGALGASITDASTSVGDIVLKMQQQANDTMVTRAGVRMREEALRLQLGEMDPDHPGQKKVLGFSDIKGYDAVSPSDGIPLTEAYNAKLKAQRDKIAGDLKNDAQRQAFSKDADNVGLAFETSALKHTMDQYHSWQSSEYKAMAEQATNKLALISPDDLDNYNLARGDLIHSVQTFNHLQGAGEAEIALATQDALGKAGKQIIDKALASDNMGLAQTYRQAHADDFSAQDRLDIDAAIKVKSDTNVYDAIGHNAVYGDAGPTGGTAAAPTGAAYDGIGKVIAAQGGTAGEVAYGKRLAQVEAGAAIAKEGTGMSAQNGGSTGTFQMQQKTFDGLVPGGNIHDLNDQAKAMLILRRRAEKTLTAAGVKADDGNVYIMHQQGDGGGKALLTGPRDAQAVSLLIPAYKGNANIALAAIAGNIGMPYKTADQKAKANEAALRMTAGQFTDYWRQRWAEGPAGAARAPASKPTPAQSLEEATEAARATAIRMGKDPEKAMATASRFWAIHDSTTKEANHTALNNAYTWLENNGGNYDAMPPSLKNTVEASSWDSLRSYGANITSGKGVVTDPAAYLSLTNPAVLGALSDQAFLNLRPKISKADWDHFATERANVLHPKETADNSPQNLNTPVLNDVLESRLVALKINPHPKDKTGPEAQQIGGIQKFVRDSLYEAQIREGKRFSGAETTAHIDALFNKSIPFKSKLFGMTIGDADAQPLLSVTDVKDIPAKDLADIRSRFTRRGIQNPGDDAILYAWRMDRTK
jgi:hypothetical protein